MRFEARRATLADLLAARERLLPAYGLDLAVHRALPEFWRAGFESDAFVGHIVHETGDPGRPRYAACAVTMMARAEFLAAVLNAERGGFGEHAVRWHLEGKAPWLTAEEASRASVAGGVDTVGLHNDVGLGETVEENPDELLEVHNAFWFKIHRGIRIASLHRSAFTKGGLRWAANSGQRFRP